MRNLLEFERAFPDAAMIVLDQNYRSSQTILDAANAVIGNNLVRQEKDLWSALAKVTGSGATVPATTGTKLRS